jgi:hypothetical protein
MGLPANAVLKFPTPAPSNGVVIADDDGNPIAPIKWVDVIATMRPDASANYGPGQGLQPGQVRMVGRSIKPKFLPRLPRSARMTITDPVTKQTITGELTIDVPVQSKFKGVTNALGTKISGLFIEDAGQS